MRTQTRVQIHTKEGQKGSIYRRKETSESTIPMIAKITRWCLKTEQEEALVKTHDGLVSRPGHCKEFIFAEGTTDEQIRNGDEVVLRLHFVGSSPMLFKCSVDSIEGSKSFNATFYVNEVITPAES